MGKRGELKPMDAFEQSIRDSAVGFNVVMFQPGVSSRVYQSFDSLPMAIDYSKSVLKEPNKIRSAMIYAIDKHEHHALVGTVKRSDCEYKQVVPSRYT
jgi:hypothetical protein